MPDRDTLLKILDLARWAPSGDNAQPWRFEIVSDEHVAVHGFDTRDKVVYDFGGHASHIAHGALLETLRIAASGFGCAANWSLRPGQPDSAPVYDVAVRREAIDPDPLCPWIEKRVVQRRPMKRVPLSEAQREALRAAAGSDYELRFFESAADRRNVARLLWENAWIRLTCPEAFEVHRDIIEWGARYSRDRIPEQAVGVDPVTAKLMRWVMQSWPRVEFFNRYLLGTIAPRIQLDLAPALACAAHLVIIPSARCASLEDYVRAGVAVQRLWLTATAHGLHLQPQMTPVIFRWYAPAGQSLSGVADINRAVERVARRFDALAGVRRDDGIVFFCRVGVAKPPASRSLRRGLDELLAR